MPVELCLRFTCDCSKHDLFFALKQHFLQAATSPSARFSKNAAQVTASSAVTAISNQHADNATS
jgi:hypothetical protein